MGGVGPRSSAVRRPSVAAGDYVVDNDYAVSHTDVEGGLPADNNGAAGRPHVAVYRG